MKTKSRNIPAPNKIIFAIYLLVLILAPLMVTPYTGNPFYFTKNSVIMICGGIFILLSSILIFKDSIDKKAVNFDLSFSPEFDTGVLLYLLSVIASAIFSINISVSYFGTYLRPLGLEILLYVFLLYFFSNPFLKGENRRMIVLYVLESTACIISFYAVLQFFYLDPFGFQWANINRPVSTVGNSTFLAGILLLVFPFSVYRIIRQRKINAGILSPFLILFTIIISQTRTAYVASIIEIGVILFLYPLIKDSGNRPVIQKIKYSVLVFSGIIISIMILILLFPDNIFAKRFLNITDFNNARWLLWRDSLSIFKKFPITGCGVSTFPLAFDDVYTMEFKIRDVGGNYDSAHSNYIHILCTMGILGFIAYIFFIGRSLYLTFKSVFSRSLRTGQKLFYLSASSMFIGYIIFGIADFDDIQILLFLFAYLGVIKANYVDDHDIKSPLLFGKLKKIIPVGSKFIFSVLVIYLCYNIYISFVSLEADKYFGYAYSYESQNLYQPAIDNYSAAINLCGNNSYFRYRLGCTLFDCALPGANLSLPVRKAFLERSKSELMEAVRTYPFKKDCLLLVSIINFELGDTIEGNKIKNDLLSRDSLFVTFRVALSEYYLYKKDFEHAFEQTLFVCLYDPNNDRLPFIITSLLNDKSSPNPKMYAEKILEAIPANQIAARYLKKNP